MLAWAIAIATVLPVASVSAPQVALSAIGADLGASLPQLQWTIAAYALALGVAQLASGPIADHAGRRRLTLHGLAWFAAGGALTACAWLPEVAIAGRIVQGLGGATILTGGLALLGVSFPDQGRRLRALGTRSTAIATAYAVGPLAGGLLVDALGWRWLFAASAAIALPLLVAVARAAPPEGERPAARVDAVGLALVTATGAAALLAILRADEAGWASAGIAAPAGVAVAGALALASRHRRGRLRLLPAETLVDRSWRAATTALAAFYVAVFGALAYITVYLVEVGGWSPTATGLLLLPYAAGALAAVGAVTRRASPAALRSLVVAGLACGAAGLVAVATAVAVDSLPGMLGGLAILGVATGTINPMLTALQLASFPVTASGAAAAVNGATRHLATALGIALQGAVVQAFVAGRPGGEAYASAVVDGVAVACAAAALLLAATAVTVRGRLAPQPR